MEKPEFVQEKHLEYLDNLRESGKTNMFGARPYLMLHFSSLSEDQAGTVLHYWMETFSERQDEKENRYKVTKEQVTKAFKELRKLGYFARQNFLCCQSCGWATVPEEKADKVVFYHNQDNEAWNSNRILEHDLYLAWSGNASEIRSVFESNGMRVDHDGSQNTRIVILAK